MSLAQLSEHLNELRRPTAFEWDLVAMAREAGHKCDDLDAVRHQLVNQKKDIPQAEAIAEHSYQRFVKET